MPASCGAGSVSHATILLRLLCREKIMHAAIYKYLRVFPEDVRGWCSWQRGGPATRFCCLGQTGHGRDGGSIQKRLTCCQA